MLHDQILTNNNTLIKKHDNLNNDKSLKLSYQIKGKPDVVFKLVEWKKEPCDPSISNQCTKKYHMDGILTLLGDSIKAPCSDLRPVVYKKIMNDEAGTQGQKKTIIISDPTFTFGYGAKYASGGKIIRPTCLQLVITKNSTQIDSTPIKFIWNKNLNKIVDITPKTIIFNYDNPKPSQLGLTTLPKVTSGRSVSIYGIGGTPERFIPDLLHSENVPDYPVAYTVDNITYTVGKSSKKPCSDLRPISSRPSSYQWYKDLRRNMNYNLNIIPTQSSYSDGFSSFIKRTPDHHIAYYGSLDRLINQIQLLSGNVVKYPTCFQIIVQKDGHSIKSTPLKIKWDKSKGVVINASPDKIVLDFSNSRG